MNGIIYCLASIAAALQSLLLIVFFNLDISVALRLQYYEVFGLPTLGCFTIEYVCLLLFLISEESNIESRVYKLAFGSSECKRFNMGCCMGMIATGWLMLLTLNPINSTYVIAAVFYLTGYFFIGLLILLHRHVALYTASALALAILGSIAGTAAPMSFQMRNLMGWCAAFATVWYKILLFCNMQSNTCIYEDANNNAGFNNVANQHCMVQNT